MLSKTRPNQHKRKGWLTQDSVHTCWACPLHSQITCRSYRSRHCSRPRYLTQMWINWSWHAASSREQTQSWLGKVSGVGFPDLHSGRHRRQGTSQDWQSCFSSSLSQRTFQLLYRNEDIWVKAPWETSVKSRITYRPSTHSSKVVERGDAVLEKPCPRDDPCSSCLSGVTDPREPSMLACAGTLMVLCCR